MVSWVSRDRVESVHGRSWYLLSARLPGLCRILAVALGVHVPNDWVLGFWVIGIVV